MTEELSVLVNRCLAGHQPSFGQLVERFRGQVYGLCFRMLGQREDAEDATQETFVRVIRNLHRWDQGRAFEPWLLTIAGNRCRTKLARRMKRPGNVSLDQPIPMTGTSMKMRNFLTRKYNWLCRRFATSIEKPFCYSTRASSAMTRYRPRWMSHWVR